LWNENQKLWWSGPDDPNVRVVRVEPEKAEMWDGPASSAVAAFEFAKARLTGSKPDLGENRKVSVELD
jgi:general stress protein 26